eukprot:CAMPEP_0194311190 /NCGR_PEP_ID=MMETSP0171-20130528/8187_1 /TAXON_ID=218684 /ORGANISM="Corethron pennatum, Strain L29A3" /LENGTH=227 /DNA_ID=CAMNT_0039065205 /DNA_START=250 /DNA_END=933 /DNA_ORIENTATION=+
MMLRVDVFTIFVFTSFCIICVAAVLIKLGYIVIVDDIIDDGDDNVVAETKTYAFRKEQIESSLVTRKLLAVVKEGYGESFLGKLQSIAGSRRFDSFLQFTNHVVADGGTSLYFTKRCNTSSLSTESIERRMSSRSLRSTRSLTDPWGENASGPDGAAPPPCDTSCSICLMDYEQGDLVSWSPNRSCEHAFHHECISGWLSGHPNCPICRRDYLKVTDGNDPEDPGIA